MYFDLPTELDLVSLAQGFALPHLPKMPELKGKDVSSFTPHTRPHSEIPYKDKVREKERKAKMKRQAGQCHHCFYCI